MPSKIIQIIPAPPNMWARWEPDDGGELEYSHVVCLALMQEEDGGTYVTPMVAFLDGDILNPLDFSNFGGIEFRKFEVSDDGN